MQRGGAIGVDLLKSLGKTAAAKLGKSGSASISQAAQAAKSKLEAQATTTALKSAGWSEADSTTATTLLNSAGGTSTVVSSVKTFFTVSVPAFFTSWGKALNPMSIDPAITIWSRIFAYLPFIILGLAIFVYFAIKRGWFIKKTNEGVNVQQKDAAEAIGGALNAKSANAPSTVVEKFADTPQPVSPDTYTLVNIQPRTIKQVGFIGPLPEGGFDAATGASQALRAGFRSFIFQIDYLDTTRDLTKFPAPGVATLLYRGDDGSLLSVNSADIFEVAQTMSNIAFTPASPNYTEPLIIYLHVLRTPSAIRDPEGYIKFLGSIATALNPLAPNHLGMTPLGVFNRQKQESVLMNTPLKNFEGQVIILSNADTTPFRKATPQVNPADDLDYWVNARVYLDSPEDAIGVTQAPPAGITPSAIVVKLNDVLQLSEKKAEAFAAKSKTMFVIAMPSQLNNPTTKQLDAAINSLGINVVPIDIFSDTVEKVQALVEEYSNMTFRPKPIALQNAR